tara:strand:- start:2385 stop:2591 length:207 start_codon:yes stop_codon:yes gene_type:complete
MPTKFKPSQTVRLRGEAKASTTNFFIKGTSKEELFEYINSSNGKPKIKQKCRNELVRRGIKIVHVPAA